MRIYIKPITKTFPYPKIHLLHSDYDLFPEIRIQASTSMADRLWENCRREWIRALYSPIFVTLASGTLQEFTYYNFLSQERHCIKFLDHVLGLAEECTDEDDAKISIRQLRKHEYFVQERGPDWIKTFPRGSVAEKYTDFLLATASGKIEGAKLATPFEKTKLAAYTLGAVMPWLQLYAYIGKELQTLVDAQALIPWEQIYPYISKELKKELEIDSYASGSSHPHKKWIDFYASDNFQVLTYEIMELLDKLSASLNGEECDIVQMLYYRAMKLMLDFFYAQPMVQITDAVPLLSDHHPSKHHLMVFSGFDFTCSVVNSSAILAEIAKASAPKFDQLQSQKQIDQMISANMTGIRGRLLCREYTKEYEQCITNIVIAEERTKAIEEHDEIIDRILQTGKAKKFDYIALKKALEQLSKFEKDANNVVFESGVLKGLNLEDIKRAGEALVFQDGCISFFQSITKKERISASIHVLSYCWCNDLIKSAFSAGDLPDVDIHANELIYDKKSISTREIVNKVECPNDKVKCFANIRKRSVKGREKLIVYIGHSVSDLLCLLEADIGIVFNSSDSLTSVGRCFGVCFDSLFHALVRKQKGMVEGGSSFSWTKKSGTLYTVSSWAEIHAFIVGFIVVEEW